MSLIDELDRLTQRHAAGDISDQEYADLWSAALRANQHEAIGLPSTPPDSQFSHRDPRQGITDVTAPFSELVAPLPEVGSLRGGQDSAQWRGPIATVVCALGVFGVMIGAMGLASPFRSFLVVLLTIAGLLALAAGFCLLIPSRLIYRIGLALLLAAWLCGLGTVAILYLEGVFHLAPVSSTTWLYCALVNAPAILLVPLWLLRHRADIDSRPDTLSLPQDDS